MNSHNLLILLLPLLTTTLYDVSSTGKPIELTLRVGESQAVGLPFNFHKVRDIKINASISPAGQPYYNQICQTESATLEVTPIGNVVFPEFKFFRDVVTSYEQLIAEQSVLDLIVYNDQVYVALQSGHIRVLSILKDDKDMVSGLAQAQTLYGPNITTLGQGNFVIGKDALFYFCKDMAILINKTLIQLDSYHMQHFQTAQYVPESDVFAVACGPDGVHIFILQTYQLTKTFEFGKNYFEFPADISDLKPYKGRLILLNRNSTVMQIELNISDFKHNKLRVTGMGKIKCEEMAISDDILYLSCPEVQSYTLTDRNYLAKYPHPRFSVKNLVVSDNYLVLTSENIVKVYYEQSELIVFQSFSIDRITFYKGLFIIATEQGVTLSSWNFVPPILTCGLASASNPEAEGQFTTLLNVTAQCNKAYFQNFNLTYQDSLVSEQCVYHFPVYIDFWIGKEVNLIPFQIMVSVVILALIILAILWYILQSQYKNIEQAIRKITQKATGKQPYNPMVQEADPSSGQGEVAEANNKTLTEEHIEKQLHEIGE